ncbi:MAG: tetratricopeptide repeat protein [Candidatus Pacebacteria bacterium]|nr:tetratricopeptide repeat protein [Candidatus Paceibacterota bacterium]
MFKKPLKFVIYALVFLMPIFWLPFSVEAFEFNKIYLMGALVMIGMVFWLGRMVFDDKKLSFKWSLLDPFVLVFLIVSTVSSFLGIDRSSSLLGFYGRFWPSLIGLYFAAGFYFLVTNNIAKDDINKVLKIFITSNLLAVLVAYLAVFGLWGRINVLLGSHLPAIMSLRTFSMTGGSLEGLSMFLACLSVMIITFVAFSKNPRKEIVSYLTLFASLGLLIIIDFQPAWITMLLALVLFLVFSLWKRIFKTDVNRLTLATLCCFIALVFIFTSPVKSFLDQTVTSGGLPKEVLLNERTSWQMAVDGFKERWLLGAGTANLHYVFAKFKPAAFLQTDFWQLRFDRTGSYWAEVLAENGALGALSYLALIGMFILISYFFVASFKFKLMGSNPVSGDKKITVIALLVSFLAILAAQFFYYQTTVLSFIFWLVLALGVVSWGEALREKSFSFKDFPEAGLVFSIVFWVVLVGAAFISFTLGKYYLADAYYREYLVDPAANLPKLETAARVAPARAVYPIVLSRAYLQKFVQEAQKAEPEKELAAEMINEAVRESKIAVEKFPNLVAAHETAGVVYREIQGAVAGSREWAIKSFEAALKLEPKNPVFLTELGKLELADKKNDEAKDFFQQAVAIKPDYVDAHLQMAFLEDEEGSKQEAQGRLENLVRLSPFSVDAHFQLGRIYFNSGEYDKAQEQFQTVLALYPNHSNSLYSLALVYEKEGEKDKALELLNRVLELNPGNQDVKQKISAVKNEKSTPVEESAEE